MVGVIELLSYCFLISFSFELSTTFSRLRQVQRTAPCVLSEDPADRL